MWRSLLLSAGFVFSVFTLIAQQADVDVLRFYTPDGAPYIEVHVGYGGGGWAAWEREGAWVTEAELEVRAMRGGEEVMRRSVVLTSPAESDSAGAVGLANFHLERMQMPGYGDYRVQVSLRDLVGNGLISNVVEVRCAGLDRPTVSDILLVQAYRPAGDTLPGPFFRSGYEMLPAVGGVLAPGGTSVRMYVEVYGMDGTGDSLCLLTCAFADATGRPIAGTERLFRRRTASVLPLFESLSLPPGAQPAFVVVTGETRTREVVAVNRVPLRWEVQETAVASGGERADWIGLSGEALRRAVEDLYPIARPSEKGTIERVIPTAAEPMLRSFVTEFMVSRFPEDPGQGWAAYLESLAYVDSAFGACRNGRGARTDMGSVYLRFGPPNTRVRRHNETEYYPYEIWHYHRAGAFTNKRFLFYAPYAVAECFEILHSDLLGEISNPDWLTQLRNRENANRVTDTQMNRLNLRRDTYSRSEPEDLFFNPR